VDQNIFPIATELFTEIYLVFFFLSILVFLTAFFSADWEIKLTFSLKFAILKKLVYILGFLSSLFLIVIPPATKSLVVNPSSIFLSFKNLPFFPLIRILSAYFIISVFPGYVVYDKLIKHKVFNGFEGMGLILLTSYCISLVFESTLFYFDIYHSISFSLFFVVLVWVFVGLINVIGNIFCSSDSSLINDNRDSKDSFNLLHVLFLSIVVIYVYLSYFDVFSSSTLSGLIGADPAHYAKHANLVINYPSHMGTPAYIGIYFFLSGTSLLVGLPMNLTFAGLQFFQASLPLSFYSFTRRICDHSKDQETISILSTFLMLFMSGLTGLTLLISKDMLKLYLGGNTLDVLWSFLYRRTGSPGISPIILSAYTFDCSLTLYALALLYVYLTSKSSSFMPAILSAFFATIAFYTHSINFVLIFMIISLLLILCCKKAGERKRLTTMFLLFACLLIIFNLPFSNFLNLAFMRFSNIYGYMFENIILAHATIILVILVFCFVVMLISKRCFRLKLNILQRQLCQHKIYLNTHIVNSVLNYLGNLFTKEVLKVAFFIMGLLLFLLALSFYIVNIEQVMHTRHWYNRYYVFPWYFIVYKYYGILFPLAIFSVPYLTKLPNKTGIKLLTCFVISCLIPAMLSLIFPEVLFPSLIYNRYLSYIGFPISALSAVSLNQFLKYIKKIKIKTFRTLSIQLFVTFIFLSMITLPLLSHTYARETWYLMGQKMIVTSDIVESINWINKYIPEGATILPLSLSSELILTNLAYNIKVIPISHQYFKEIFITKSERTSAESILYTLHSLGVSYIFVCPYDIQYLRKEFKESDFLSILNYFPVVFEKGETKIYAVPNTLENRKRFI